MEFGRIKYLQNLIEGRGNGLVKIVTGVRRCGKSYLLFKIFTKWLKEHGVDENHIIGLSLDDYNNRQLRNPDNLLNYIDGHLPKDGQTAYVILDEVQLIENFVEVILSIMHINDVEIYVSGSNSRFLSSDVVTEFRGRGDEIRVYPLSVSEVVNGTGADFNKVLQEYFIYGGLPQVVLQDSENKKNSFLREMFELTYLKDIIDRNNIRNADVMRELIQVLSSVIGASSNPKRISDTFKSVSKLRIAAATVNDYIGYLKDAFLIEEGLRYDVKGRKYIGTETKYFFSDMGIRNVALNFRQIEENHIMENLIFNELKGRGYSVDVGLVELWTKDENNKNKRLNLEVDFVVNQGSMRYYIQSAFALPTMEKVEQEERPLKSIPDSFKKIVIVKDDILLRRNNDGIVTMGLRQFLLDDNSLNL